MKSLSMRFYKYSWFSNFILERSILFTYYIQICGFSVVEVGMFQFAFTISNSLFEIPLGYISDKIGRKKMIIIGLLAKALGTILLLVNINFEFFLILSIVQGFGFACISGSDQALLYDNLKKRKDENAYINIVATSQKYALLSAFVATILGGFLQNITWTIVFGISTLMYFFSINEIYKIEDFVDTNHIPFNSIINEYKNIKKEYSGKLKNLCLFILGIAFFESSFLCFFMVGQIIFLEYSFPVQNIALIYALTRLLSAISYHLIPKMRKHASDFIILFFSTITASVIVFFTILNSKYAFLILFILFTFVSHFAPSIYSGKLNEKINSRSRTTIISITTFLSSLILSIQYYFSGKIITSYGIQYFSFAIFMFIIMGSLLMLAFFNNKKQKIREYK